MTLTKTQAVQRLRKLEAELLPPPRLPTAILYQPKPDATPAEQEAFERDLAAARAAGARIWVVTGKAVDHMDPDGDVTYLQHDWHAWCCVLSHAPSSEGRQSALQDLWASLSGNIAEPDPLAALPDEDEPDDDEIDGERATRRDKILRCAMEWRDRFRP